MSKLERIQDGLNARGIPAKIVNMSIDAGTQPTKKELEEKIKRDTKELQMWTAKGDHIMEQILTNRIRKTEQELSRMTESEGY
ncbi:hypothetical protein [Diplocloster hominis]|uniref:hypothetical protein n=1 Tax=Diplocloster hominis TaxID=3079010 RepID=UPI0031BB299D